jgi:hypothetical protein
VFFFVFFFCFFLTRAPFNIWKVLGIPCHVTGWLMKKFLKRRLGKTLEKNQQKNSEKTEGKKRKASEDSRWNTVTPSPSHEGTGKMPFARRNVRSVSGAARVDDPPKTPSRNSKKPYREEIELEEDSHDGSDDVVFNIVEKAKKKIVEKRFRAGKPSKPPPRVTYGGKRSFVVEVNAYKRLYAGREKAEQEVQRLRLLMKKRDRRMSLANRVVVASLLQSQRVSGAQVSHVLSICSLYLTGEVSKNHLIGTTSALKYVRMLDVVLRNRMISFINENHLPYCIGTDTSSRGGSIGANVVSFRNPQTNELESHFFGFDSPTGHTSVDLLQCLLDVEKKLDRGRLVGLVTDAPNVMIGKDNGLGVLLCKEMEVFIYHHTCELHALANLLKSLQVVWPAQMNVASVVQFGYLCWYILNSFWKYFKGKMKGMIKELFEENKVKEMINRFDGDSFALKQRQALLGLKKPDRPVVARFGTLAEIIEFIPKYSEVLRLSFDEFREMYGSGAQNGSVAAMCSQWIKWSGSGRLLALMDMAMEFVEMWKVHNAEIDKWDVHYGTKGNFKTHSRTRRVVRLMMDIDEKLGMLDQLPSKKKVLKAFGEDMKGEVDALYHQLYSVAKKSVLRSGGRYTSGVYLVMAIADPDMCVSAWNALSTYLKNPKRPKPNELRKDKMALYLLHCMETAPEFEGYEKDEFESLTSAECKEDMFELVKKCKSGKEVLVEAIINPQISNHVAKKLKKQMCCQSVTRNVEQKFQAYDQFQASSGDKVKKSSKSTGKAVGIDLVSAKVNVRSFFNKIKDKELKQTKNKKKSSAAHDEVIKGVKLTWERLDPTEEELKCAKEEVENRTQYQAEPRFGVSEAVHDMFAVLEMRFENAKPSKKHLDDLLRDGRAMNIQIKVKCSSDCLKLDSNMQKDSGKGSEGKTVTCGNCLRIFHVKCMVNESLMSEDVLNCKKAELLKVKFVCEICKDMGVEEANVGMPNQPNVVASGQVAKDKEEEEEEEDVEEVQELMEERFDEAEFDKSQVQNLDVRRKRKNQPRDTSQDKKEFDMTRKQVERGWNGIAKTARKIVAQNNVLSVDMEVASKTTKRIKGMQKIVEVDGEINTDGVRDEAPLATQRARRFIKRSNKGSDVYEEEDEVQEENAPKRKTRGKKK